MKAVDANQRVLQTGSMQRSMKEFRVACELVRNGAIGKIERVECSFGDPAVPCDLPEEPMEPGLDWDLGLGPAPMRALQLRAQPARHARPLPELAQLPRVRRRHGDRLGRAPSRHRAVGARHGRERPGRGASAGADGREARGHAGLRQRRHRDARGRLRRGLLRHRRGACRSTAGRFTFTREGRRIAWFTEREDGTSCEGQVAKAEKEFLKDAKVRLYVSTDHVADFLDGVNDRGKPITNEQVGGRSAICCHLMNLAYLPRPDPRGTRRRAPSPAARAIPRG